MFFILGAENQGKVSAAGKLPFQIGSGKQRIAQYRRVLHRGSAEAHIQILVEFGFGTFFTVLLGLICHSAEAGSITYPLNSDKKVRWYAQDNICLLYTSRCV